MLAQALSAASSYFVQQCKKEIFTNYIKILLKNSTKIIKARYMIASI